MDKVMEILFGALVENESINIEAAQAIFETLPDVCGELGLTKSQFNAIEDWLSGYGYEMMKAGFIAGYCASQALTDEAREAKFFLRNVN